MSFLDRVQATLTDDRFLSNLLATYGVIAVLVAASLVARRLLGQGGERLAQWTGLHWLEGVGREAALRARRLLVRATLASVFVLTLAGVGYHLAGRDVRADAAAWYERLTADDWLLIGLRAGAVVGLGLGAWVAVRVVRRLRANLEPWALARLDGAANEEVVRRWFGLVERFGAAAVVLAAVWGAGQAVGLGAWADVAVGFVLRVLSIVVVARLLTLSCRTVTRLLAHVGDRYLAGGQFRHYWERVKRLFPFGERCFEAAVYIQAASLCVGELQFIAFVTDFGPKIVQCIGIFFTTRVLIELSYVLLHEAFGLYRPGAEENQKGRTLVPLLHSCCQYVLYFGSAVVMLGVLGVDTKPILAGAGILGLAVGLGAQSLVTDVVSGFFILFENQYLVGDYVQIGEAVGTVEAVGIRLTQVRDARGKLHLIPNGQIKGVVNYSKGYVNAVVDVRVPCGSDLEAVFRAVAEAGRRLRQAHREVLADTVAQGLVELGASEMTVRAVTKVMPGTHEAMQNEYRRVLKAVLDETQAADRPRIAA
jgi:small conductance mechanosensitive channel